MTKTWFTSYGIDFSGTNLPLKSNQNAMEPSVFNLKVFGECGNELQSHYFFHFQAKVLLANPVIYWTIVLSFQQKCSFLEEEAHTGRLMRSFEISLETAY